MTDAAIAEPPNLVRRKLSFKRPLLYPKQQEAIFDPHRYSIIEASTKSGKTSGCIVWLIEEAFRTGLRGRNYWWVAPVSGQANIAFRRAIRALPRKAFLANLSDKTITLTTGAVLWFKSADHPDCYDDQTEVLTIDGWKLFADLSESDEVMTRSSNGTAQWQKLTRIIKRYYDGDMITVRSSRIDLMVTPNHRQLIDRRRGRCERGKWDRAAPRTGNICNRVEMWTTADRLKPTDTIPSWSKWNGYDDPSISADDCALLGFYLAEGSALGNASSDEKAKALVARCGYRIHFAQTAGLKGGTKGDVRAQFADVLHRLGYDRVSQYYGGLLIWNKSLWATLIVLGNRYTKAIPQNIKNLPAPKLRVLLHWLVMGDGSQRGEIPESYATVSKKLADDVQEIAIKCGISSVIVERESKPFGRPGAIASGRPLYIVNFHVPVSHCLSSSKHGRFFARTRYRGMIYCVSVPNTCVLVRRSGKPCWSGNSLYGDDVYAAVIDEASRMKEDAWIAVRSTLTATRGPVRIIGNVKGRRNWFYKMARRAETGDPRMGYHKIVAQDAVDAGVLEAEEIEDARADMPEAVWRELYLAEASDDEGNPFGLEHIAKCLTEGLSNLPPKWWGWDLAKKRDWTVGIALDKNGNVCRFERFQHTPWPQTLERILALTQRTSCLIDSTGVGDPIVDGLVAHKNGGPNFVGYQFTQPSKQRLMEGLAVAIQSANIGYPDGVIKDELDVFEYEYTRLGVRYTAPPGFHDDCVCALALAVMCRGSADPHAYDVTQRWVRGEDDE